MQLKARVLMTQSKCERRWKSKSNEKAEIQITMRNGNFCRE